MQLKLSWSETARHSAAAAFIAGSRPEQWLAEINRWGVPFADMECYALPESLRSVQAAGLLVVFKNAGAAARLDLKDPYARVGERLFIPLHTGLHPEIGAGEWPRLLSYDVQILHPVIGLVGFNAADRLDFATLLAESPAAGTDWSKAGRGLPPKPGLEYIEVHRPRPEDVISSVRGDLTTRPLRDIPKEEEDEPTPLQQALDRAKRGLIKGTLNALDQLGEAPAKPGQGANWLGRLQEWLERNLEELERRRNNELKRLVDLFDKNSDEALKYAIPLDDNYAARGTAPPTWKLGPRDANFDLSRIGGGEATDAWDVSAHYNDLRAQYHRAAQEAMAKGDFRKAAYIYAHLLNDFHLAAGALKKGGFYQEAAVLYQDHLKNLPAAAECLELGGLYQEAAELYGELKRYEKAGDLYAQIERPEKAAAFYEKSLDVALKSDDHLDGARIAAEKLRQAERANQILLKGWQGAKQSEPCLKLYFDRLQEADPDKLPRRMTEIFERQTPPAKRPLFLNVLLHLNSRFPKPEIQDTSRQIAWEIAGEAAGRGELLPLKTLPKFLPADRLIAGDASRFIHLGKKTTAQEKPLDRFQLDSNILWLNAAAYSDQFLAAGLKNGRLQLARGNWYGHVEYYAWEEPVYDNPKPVFVLNHSESQFVFVRCAGRPALHAITLQKGPHFYAHLSIGSSSWLPKNDLGLWIGQNDRVTALVNTHGKLELQYYDITGKPERTAFCSLSGKDVIPAPYGNDFPGLIAHGDRYYTFMENALFRIEPDGKTAIHDTHWRIRQICLSPDPDLKLVALTDNGCALIRPEFDDEIRDTDFFARNFTPVTGAFLPGGHFVAVAHDAVNLFRIDNGGAAFYKTLESGTGARRIAVLPAGRRDHCAVVDASGEVRVYEL